MARKPRIEYARAVHHAMSSDWDRERSWEGRSKDIYCEDMDPQEFHKTLAEKCQQTGFQIHPYCLMANPFTEYTRFDRTVAVWHWSPGH
ncbi:MAG: hypothetical protein P4N59_23690 [Negativicutes bacterium]|nr:hypothetical protein [Negativicutes bacterium]